MDRTPARARRTVRLLSWTASAALHVMGAGTAMLLWPIVIFLFWMGGIPSDDSFTFRWDNPFYRGASIEDDAEGPVIVLRPRRRRELPELEKPRSEVVWDSLRGHSESRVKHRVPECLAVLSSRNQPPRPR